MRARRQLASSFACWLLVLVLAACATQPAGTTRRTATPQHTPGVAARTAPATQWAASTPQSTAIPPAASRGAQPNELVSGGGFAGVVFSKHASEQSPPPEGLVGAHDGYWTPGKADVAALEQRLGPYLQRTTSERNPNLVRRLAEYKRQYIGILQDGRRFIFVNFLCRTLNIDWQHVLVALDDGGECFFNLKYDPQQELFFDLFINGEA